MAIPVETSISVRAEQFDAALRRYIDELGIEARRVVQVQARLFVQQLMRYTPPKSLAQGRRAVARDIRRALGKVDPESFRDEGIRALLKSGDTDAITQVIAGSRKMGRLEVKKFSPTLHTSVRNRRGRVTKDRGVLALTPRETAKYTRDVQKRVGWTKASWLPALMAAGGAGAPGWISRHGSASGRAVNNLGDKNNPRLRVINESPGVESIDPNVIASALRTRTRAMQADIKRILKGGASRYF